MLLTASISKSNSPSPGSNKEYNTGQDWGTKLAEEFYHSISPHEIDFTLPAKRILTQLFTEVELQARSKAWMNEFYEGFLAHCIKGKLGDMRDYEVFLYQSAPSEEELQKCEQEWELWPQEISAPDYILTILNNPPAHIVDGPDLYWAFIFAHAPFIEEEPNPNDEALDIDCSNSITGHYPINGHCRDDGMG